MRVREILASCDGFEWDRGNIVKNQIKHKVTVTESEEVFSNPPFVLFMDPKHSQKEMRFGILGKTRKGRLLSVFFTVRNKKIRIISARDQKKGAETQRFKKEVI